MKFRHPLFTHLVSLGFLRRKCSMKRLALSLCFGASLVQSVSAATITGTVTDVQGQGLAGVGVSLAISGARTTTDASGAWSLNWSSTGVSDRSVHLSSSRWTGKAVELNLPSASDVTVEAFTLSGASLGRTNVGQLEAGFHRIPVVLASAGLAWLRVTTNGHAETLLAGLGSSQGNRSSAMGAGRALAVPDTLVYTWQSVVADQQLLTEIPNSEILFELDTTIPPSPVFNPSAGSYPFAPVVSVNESVGANVYYTTDGSNPTTSSLVSTYGGGGVIVDGKTIKTIKAIAVRNGVTSAVSSATYTVADIAWQTGITYGSVTDSAGQSYRTVKIGTQTWMAENLNYAGANGATGRCYRDSARYCKVYGRLYSWADVMGLDSTYVSKFRGGSSVRRQGICPTGWHVPSDSEWAVMQNTADSSGRLTETKLKSMSGWELLNAGTDVYGFRVLPAGDRTSNGWFGYISIFATFWLSGEYDATGACGRDLGAFHDGYNNVGHNSYKWVGSSLRCVQD